MVKKQKKIAKFIRKTDLASENADIDVEAFASVLTLRHPSISKRAARRIIFDVADYLGYTQALDPPPAEAPESILQSDMRFAEVLGQDGKRLHIGCIMAFGKDWVEVSHPARMALPSELQLRFLPSTRAHKVELRWRHEDRAGFTYPTGEPVEAVQLSEATSIDPRSVAEMMRS